jgi:hypothetical protein
MAVSAFSYASKASGGELVMGGLLASCFVLTVLVLSFQIIKNVYNKSYAERVLFFNLKKKSG